MIHLMFIKLQGSVIDLML